MGMSATAENQTDANYEAFVQQLPELLRSHSGTYALLHDRAVIDFYPSSLAATIAGARQFGSGAYSVQEVTEKPDHLGFYSYVGGSGAY